MITGKENVKKVAEIARLNLSQEETEKFSVEMENILSVFRELEKVNTEKVEPAFRPIEVENILREDAVEQSMSQKDAISNAQENKEEGCFKGPKAT